MRRRRLLLPLMSVVLATAITCSVTPPNPATARPADLAAVGSAARVLLGGAFALTASVDTSLPVVTGSAAQGQMLSTSTGLWRNGPTSYSYHWKACNRVGHRCWTIRGATRSRFLLTSADVGHTMRSVVTAQTPTASSSATSAPTAVVTAVLALLPPVDLSAPAISGTPQDDQTLSTSTGSWLDSPTSYTYQWQDCDNSGVNCTSIKGANQSTYTLVDADIGQTVRSVVTATNSAGSTSASSARTAAVAPPPPPSASIAPAVSGQTTQGQSLSTSNGSWTNDPSSYSYQWQTCDTSGNNCSNISGAAGSTYALTSANVGHTLRSVVTATNAGGSGSASSAPTSVVTPNAPANTTAPVVTGSAVQGQTLSTSNGSWSGSPTSYGYRWEDCNSAGGMCTTISGAT
jgi:fibronectin-binding autotransporter adhesin